MDLITISLLALLTLPLIHAVQFDSLRLILSLASILFYPGYTFICIFYTRTTDLKSTDRFALSFGLSIVLVALMGLALNFSPWGISVLSVSAFTTAVTITMCAIALFRRNKLNPNERFDPLKHLINRFSHRPYISNIWMPIFAILAIGVLGGIITLRIVNPPLGEPFTEFYMIGDGGNTSNYPTILTVGKSLDLKVGISNQELTSHKYSIKIVLNDRDIGSSNIITIGKNQSWEGLLPIIPDRIGQSQKLELKLFREEDIKAHRVIWIWVDVQ